MSQESEGSGVGLGVQVGEGVLVWVDEAVEEVLAMTEYVGVADSVGNEYVDEFEGVEKLPDVATYEALFEQA